MSEYDLNEKEEGEGDEEEEESFIRFSIRIGTSFSEWRVTAD